MMNILKWLRRAPEADISEPILSLAAEVADPDLWGTDILVDGSCSSIHRRFITITSEQHNLTITFVSSLSWRTCEEVIYCTLPWATDDERTFLSEAFKRQRKVVAAREAVCTESWKMEKRKEFMVFCGGV